MEVLLLVAGLLVEGYLVVKRNQSDGRATG